MKILAVILPLTLVACAPPLWVKPGGTTAEFDKDKYTCLQSSQQRSAGFYFNKYGGGASDNMATNETLFASCMNSKGWKLKRGDEAAQYVAGQTAKVQEAKVALEQLRQESYAICARPEFAWINQRTACDTKDLTLAQLSNSERLSPANKDSFMAFYTEAKNLNQRNIKVLKATGDKNAMATATILERLISSRERGALDLYEGKVTWGEYNKAKKRDIERADLDSKELTKR
jgi:hypothetical protein